jgi:biopolymer transport protein ExbD
MAISLGSGASSAPLADINMTPLIDVMLVLLIIFIITLPHQTHAVKIDNPLPPPPNLTPPPPPVVIDLAIDFDGTLLWNKEPVDRPTLQSRISAEATQDPQPEVHITVDKFAKYEIVAQTLADLQHRGLKKIGFVNNDFF